MEFGVLIFHKKFGFGFSFDAVASSTLVIGSCAGSSHVEGRSDGGPQNSQTVETAANQAIENEIHSK